MLLNNSLEQSVMLELDCSPGFGRKQPTTPLAEALLEYLEWGCCTSKFSDIMCTVKSLL